MWNEKKKPFCGANKINGFVPHKTETAIYFLKTPNALEKIGFSGSRAKEF